MQSGAPHLRLKVPCRDEGDFFARLADHAAQRGLRVPTEDRRPVGSPVTIAVELRNGGTLTGEGVIDGHCRLDGRPAVNVRVARFEAGAGAPAASAGSPGAAPVGFALPGGDEPLGHEPLRGEPLGHEPRRDEPLGDVLFGDALEPVDEVPPWSSAAGTVSGDIVAAVHRRTARVARAALLAVLAAVVIGVGAFAAARWLLPVGPGAEWAAHLAASDRLLADGRLIGDDGAIEHLLAARRLRPGDDAPQGRLARAADLLEALAARALDRGDVAVAAVHLTWAQRAAPDRASVRAMLEEIAKRARAASGPAGDAGRPAARPRARAR